MAAASASSLLVAAPDRIAEAARRVMTRCDELARISAAPDRIERVYLSPEHARVNRLAAEWMREVGMSTRQDAAGNQIGRLDTAAGPGSDAALMIGSHLDTVSDAGRFDGIIGVLMGLEVVRLLRAPNDAGPAAGWVAPLPFALEVAAFWDEEGTRFGKALLGSSAVGGVWDDAWWTLADSEGTTLRQAYLEFGLDPGRIGEAARHPDELIGYLEAHIEQGPELHRRGESLAVVSSIASARRFLLTVEGEARHAGGTPYDMRRDALLGASEAALAVERLCRAEHHIIGTVGQFEAFPGGVNIVPGEVQFSLDLRGEFDGERDRIWQALSGELDEIMGRRGLRWQHREIHNAAAVACAPLLQDVVRAGIGASGGGSGGVGGSGVGGSGVGGSGVGRDEAPVIFSRAGHDGMALGGLTDIGMLFLRNPDGISHHPDEDVSTEDVARGIRALAESVLHLAADRRVAAV